MVGGRLAMGPAARLEKMVRKKRGEMKLRRRRRRRRFCSALGRFVILSWGVSVLGGLQALTSF